jgi:hypothetical protein
MDAGFDTAQAEYDAAEPEWDDEDEIGGDLLNAQQVSDNLTVLLNTMSFMDDGDLESAGLDGLLNVNRVTSYTNGGVLTRDAGFTLTLDNGSEYQITVVRSR